jgi:SAM-dependent methyltransferase
MESINCQICNGSKFHPITTKGQFNIETNVVICKSCGFTFLNPRWTKEEYLKFYSQEYEKYYLRTGQDDALDLTVFTIIKERLDKLSIVHSGIKILDIGSGFGGTLRNFRKLDSSNELCAIEPSIECIDFLKSEKIEIVSNDVDTDWEKNYSNHFDLIIMRHVLEHFSDPEKTLTKIKLALKSTGVAYIAVPDIYHPKSPLNSYYFRVVHLSYFSIKSIRHLLQKASLEIINWEDNLKGELYVVVKKTEKSTSPKTSIWDYFKQKRILSKQYKKEKK